jgi:hypothetical protein
MLVARYSRGAFDVATGAPACKWNRASHPAFMVGLSPRFPELCMSILISVLITFVVVLLVLYLVNILPIDGRAKQIVRVIVIVIGIISLLRYLSVF